MSLRQLKFKPKLQLKSAAKTCENSSSHSTKEVCTSSKSTEVSTTDLNSLSENENDKVISEKPLKKNVLNSISSVTVKNKNIPVSVPPLSNSPVIKDSIDSALLCPLKGTSLSNTKLSLIGHPELNLTSKLDGTSNNGGVVDNTTSMHIPVDSSPQKITHNTSSELPNNSEPSVYDIKEMNDLSDITINLKDDAISTCKTAARDNFNLCAKKVSRIRQKPNFGLSKKGTDVCGNVSIVSDPKSEDILKAIADEYKTNVYDSTLVNEQSIVKGGPIFKDSSAKLGDEAIRVETPRTSHAPTILDLCAKKVSRNRKKPNFGLTKKSNIILENCAIEDKHHLQHVSVNNMNDQTHKKETDNNDFAAKIVSHTCEKNDMSPKNSDEYPENTLTNLQSTTKEDVLKDSIDEEKTYRCAVIYSDNYIKLETGRINHTDLNSKNISSIQPKPYHESPKKNKVLLENKYNSPQKKNISILPFKEEENNLKVSGENLCDDSPQSGTVGTASCISLDLCAKKVSRIRKKPNFGSTKNDDRAIVGNKSDRRKTVSKEPIAKQKDDSNVSKISYDSPGTLETGSTPLVIGYDLSLKQGSHFQYNKANEELQTNLIIPGITPKTCDDRIALKMSVNKETSDLSVGERKFKDDSDGRTTPTQIGFDLSPKIISCIKPEPNMLVAKYDDNISKTTLIENNNEKKNIRKKNICKSINHSANKLTSPQKGNFKPNLASIGKIKRPDKFMTSSYSKMESKVKEQFFQKFGNTEELDSSKLTMMDLIFYNPKSNPMSQSTDKLPPKAINEQKNIEVAVTKTKAEVSSVTEKNNNTTDDTNKSDILPVPQLKISADGKVIVAQESLVIKPSQNLENANFEDVIDDEFKKRKPVKNPNRCGWSHLDTIKFYKALNSLGCDFETMQSIFPDRSRRNLKSKFKKEEKAHGSLINKVLSHHSEFDVPNVVRELEIDSVYQKTIKNFGRDLAPNDKRSKGRKKSISSIIAGKSPEKNGDESNDEQSVQGEIRRRKRRSDAGMISKISNVVCLNEDKDSNEMKSSKCDQSHVSSVNDSSKQQSDEKKLSNDRSNEPLPNPKPNKRKRRKAVKYVESDSDDYESEYFINPNNFIFDQSNSTENDNSPKPTRVLRKRKPPISKTFVLSLEDLINLGIEKEPEKKCENHIVINTNIEFENVKYTRYISYNSNNLENPIEINETVAHVD